jgi:hypothetical protein
MTVISLRKANPNQNYKSDPTLEIFCMLFFNFNVLYTFKTLLHTSIFLKVQLSAEVEGPVIDVRNIERLYKYHNINAPNSIKHILSEILNM